LNTRAVSLAGAAAVVLIGAALAAAERTVWDGSFNSLYTFVVENMPKNDPGTLDETTSINIISYVLQQNGFPAGSAELEPAPELLKSILLVTKPHP